MTRLLIMGILTAVAIGTIIALITSALGSKRLHPASGSLLVFGLCLAYHAIVGFGMGTPILAFFSVTVSVPFGFGFGEGNGSFLIALTIQAILAGFTGAGIYWLIKRGK